MPELQLVKTDVAWVTEQGEHPSMSLDSTGGSHDLDTILTTLQYIKALKVLRTEWPDTLGLGQTAIHIQLEMTDGDLEKFSLGHEITLPGGQEATWFMLQKQQAVYLAEGHLRQVFDPVLRPKLRPLSNKKDAN